MWHFGFQNKKAPTKREKIIRNEKHTSVASTLCFPIMEMTVKLIACACQFNISIVSCRCWCQIGFVFIVVVIVVGFCYIFWISINSTRGKTSKTRAVNEKKHFYDRQTNKIAAFDFHTENNPTNGFYCILHTHAQGERAREPFNSFGYVSSKHSSRFSFIISWSYSEKCYTQKRIPYKYNTNNTKHSIAYLYI